jgi:adenylate kinase family enzyme
LSCAGLLKEALSDAQHTKVLIDGFPRVLDQLKEFEQEVRVVSTCRRVVGRPAELAHSSWHLLPQQLHAYCQLYCHRQH